MGGVPAAAADDGEARGRPRWAGQRRAEAAQDEAVHPRQVRLNALVLARPRRRLMTAAGCAIELAGGDRPDCREWGLTIGFRTFGVGRLAVYYSKPVGKLYWTDYR